MASAAAGLARSRRQLKPSSSLSVYPRFAIHGIEIADLSVRRATGRVDCLMTLLLRISEHEEKGKGEAIIQPRERVSREPIAGNPSKALSIRNLVARD